MFCKDCKQTDLIDITKLFDSGAYDFVGICPLCKCVVKKESKIPDRKSAFLSNLSTGISQIKSLLNDYVKESEAVTRKTNTEARKQLLKLEGLLSQFSIVMGECVLQPTKGVQYETNPSNRR